MALHRCRIAIPRGCLVRRLSKRLCPTSLGTADNSWNDVSPDTPPKSNIHHTTQVGSANFHTAVCTRLNPVPVVMACAMKNAVKKTKIALRLHHLAHNSNVGKPAPGHSRVALHSTLVKAHAGCICPPIHCRTHRHKSFKLKLFCCCEKQAGATSEKSVLAACWKQLGGEPAGEPATDPAQQPSFFK